MAKLFTTQFLLDSDSDQDMKGPTASIPELETAATTLRCNRCKFGCKIKSAMHQHLLEHQGFKPYSCSKCKFVRGFTQEEIQVHIQMCHRIIKGHPIYPEYKLAYSKQKTIYNSLMRIIAQSRAKESSTETEDSDESIISLSPHSCSDDDSANDSVVSLSSEM